MNVFFTGFAGATILMMFPPSSGRKSVRLRNAALITEMSLLYSQLMSVWISDIEATEDGDTVNPGEPDKGEGGEVTTLKGASPAWARKIRKKVLTLAEQVQGLRAQIATAGFEGNIRGAWPADDYNKLCDCTADMLASFFQVGYLALPVVMMTHIDRFSYAALCSILILPGESR